MFGHGDPVHAGRDTEDRLPKVPEFRQRCNGLSLTNIKSHEEHSSA